MAVDRRTVMIGAAGALALYALPKDKKDCWDKSAGKKAASHAPCESGKSGYEWRKK